MALSDGESAVRAKRGWNCAVLAAVALSGFLFRSCGIAHDLDAGRVYHPDTMKQVSATQRFLEGSYYEKCGDPDYDGYPLFNSHLVEYLSRAAAAAAKAGADHAGLRDRERVPSWNSLFWVTRLWNALLSTLTILAAYFAAKELFGKAAGIFASLLLAISPVDIAAAHYATGDAAAAFFAALALLFSVRIYTRGGARDYAAAAICAVFAFSAKYHGGMAAFSCLAAHFLRFRGVRGFFSAAALRRAGLAAGAACVAFVLANPALFTAPAPVLRDILDFLRHTSNHGMDPATVKLPLAQRWFMGLKHCYPDFRAMLGPVLVPVLLVGIPAAARRNRGILILAALPFMYVFVGLAFKPIVQPIYHTLITPALFVSAAGIAAAVWDSGRFRAVARAAVAIATAATALSMTARVREETFFFRRNDTQLAFHYWMERNVPPSFHAWCPKHPVAVLLGLSPDPERPEEKDGEALVYSPVMPAAAERERECAVGRRFDWLDRSLSRFRNIPIEVCVYSREWIRPGWRRPVFQPVPAKPAEDVILCGAREFFRTPAMVEINPGALVERYLLSEAAAVSNAVVTARCGTMPGILRISVGGRRREIVLQPGTTAALEFENLDPAFRSVSGGRFYRVAADARIGTVMVTVATTAEDKGICLFNAGRYDKAHPYLREACESDGNPTVAAMAAVCARRMGNEAPGPPAPALAEFMAGEWTADRITEVYGISTKYLDALPYLEFGRGDIAVRPAGAGTAVSVSTMLLRGAYVAKVTLGTSAVDWPAPDAGLRAELADARTEGMIVGQDFAFSELSASSPGERKLEFRFLVPDDTAVCRLQVNLPAGIRVDSIAIRPDLVRTLEALRGELAGGGEPAPRGPAEDVPAARCDAVFENGLVLRSYRMDRVAVRAGESLYLNLYWETPSRPPEISRLAVWIHFVGKDGKPVFQGDRMLSEFIVFRESDGMALSDRCRVPVPPEVPPGTYEIRVGLYVPSQWKRVGLKSAARPCAAGGVCLGELTVGM